MKKINLRKVGMMLVAFPLAVWAEMPAQKTFHDYSVKDIQGQTIKLSSLKGKKVLVVNVASKCGLTPQYKELQVLYKKYGGARFEIVAFPANNFGKQEPGTNSEIRNFCSQTYGVTFSMMSKISVKGEDQAPVYKWLTQKALNGKQDSQVQWNFQKYLIDEEGQWVAVLPPRTSPMSLQIIDWLEGK